MLCTLWDPIVFTSMEYIKYPFVTRGVTCKFMFTTVGYIKLDHLSRKMCYTNIRPVTVWMFLELWDTIYLLMTSEYVFCCCSIGVGVLSYDLARRNCPVELWIVLSGNVRCLFLFYVVRDKYASR